MIYYNISVHSYIYIYLYKYNIHTYYREHYLEFHAIEFTVGERKINVVNRIFIPVH